METTNAKLLKIANINIDICAIDYKRSYEESSSSDMEAKIKQNAELKEFTFDSIDLLVTRTISFEPRGIFDLEISAIVTLYLDKEESIDFGADKDKMKEYINAKLSILVEKCGVGNVLSSLISQITGSCGNIPFVTPPNLSDADNQTII